MRRSESLGACRLVVFWALEDWHRLDILGSAERGVLENLPLGKSRSYRIGFRRFTVVSFARDGDTPDAYVYHGAIDTHTMYTSAHLI